MMKTLLALTVFLLLSVAHARQPAVLPVRGISIEEIEPIPPSQAKQIGFDFKKGKPIKQLGPNATKPRQSSPVWLLTTVALLLPLLGLPVLFRRKEVESTYPDNMIFLEDRRQDYHAKVEDNQDLDQAS